MTNTKNNMKRVNGKKISWKEGKIYMKNEDTQRNIVWMAPTCSSLWNIITTTTMTQKVNYMFKRKKTTNNRNNTKIRTWMGVGISMHFEEDHLKKINWRKLQRMWKENKKIQNIKWKQTTTSKKKTKTNELTTNL